MSPESVSLVEGEWVSAQLNNKPSDPRNNVRGVIAIKSGKLTREPEHSIYVFGRPLPDRDRVGPSGAGGRSGRGSRQPARQSRSSRGLVPADV